MVPYTLPKEIEEKLMNLMNNLGYNTGSIDMIYSTDKKYYFLEINPAGQFGWTSNICNYNVHKHIAQYLINQTQI